jgi:hypothetical protein
MGDDGDGLAERDERRMSAEWEDERRVGRFEFFFV